MDEFVEERRWKREFGHEIKTKKRRVCFVGLWCSFVFVCKCVVNESHVEVVIETA